jgi:hypothetical protein
VNVLPTPGRFAIDFASQQTGQFAADRKTQPGAAILAAGGPVGLLERFENDSLLVGLNADARIGNGERDYRFGTAKVIWFAAPAGSNLVDR